MSEHCQFIVIPVDGLPYVVDSHPYPDRVSDALAALPVAVVDYDAPHPPSATVWVRETAATEGQPRNVMASLMLRVLTGPPVQAVLGPAVLTRIAVVPNPSGALALGAEGFPRPVTEAMLKSAADMARALAGQDDGFESPQLDPLWASSVRAAAEAVRQAPIGDPYPAGPSAAPFGAPDDQVAAIMQKLGLGETFAPVPIPQHLT